MLTLIYLIVLQISMNMLMPVYENKEESEQQHPVLSIFMTLNLIDANHLPPQYFASTEPKIFDRVILLLSPMCRNFAVNIR